MSLSELGLEPCARRRLPAVCRFGPRARPRHGRAPRRARPAQRHRGDLGRRAPAACATGRPRAPICPPSATGSRSPRDRRGRPRPSTRCCRGARRSCARPPAASRVEQVVAANVDIVFLVAVAQRRPQPAPARALPRARLGERRRAGRRADQGRPRRRPRGGRRRGRARRLRRARAGGLGASPARASRRCAALPRRRAARRRCSARRASASRRSSTRCSARSGWRTAEIREDDARGRHTTTHRELLAAARRRAACSTRPACASCSCGTPTTGSRRPSRTSRSWPRRAASRDCAPQQRAGLRGARGARGRRARRRPLASFRKLQRELRYLEIRHDARARSDERKRWRALSREQRQRSRD